MQEVDIEKVDASIVTNGAIEEKAIDEVAGSLEVPNVIIRAPMPENIIMYNQLNVDPYACTIVATFTAVSNLLNDRFAYKNMQVVLEKMDNAKKFTPKVGAYLEDAINFSLENINQNREKKVVAHKILLTLPAVLEGLKHSCVVTGIKYGKGYIQDEQDNTRVDNLGSVGAQGHAISFCSSWYYREKYL